MLSIWDCKTQVLQIFLQYCYNAILKVKLHYSSILQKNNNNILFSFSPIFLSPFSHYFYSLLSPPSLFLICSLLSSNPNIILLPTSTSHITTEETLRWFFFSLSLSLLWCCDSHRWWVDQRWRKRWSSGGGVWVLIGVDQRWRKRWSSSDSGNVDLTAAVSEFWSGLIWVFFLSMGFCSSGILVGSGGVVGMVEARWWWLGNGGAVLEVEGACE